MNKDDKWFNTIKWNAICIVCQSENNGLCPNRNCAEDNYDEWGDPIPLWVYHMDGNILAEYLEEKRKRMETQGK